MKRDIAVTSMIKHSIWTQSEVEWGGVRVQAASRLTFRYGVEVLLQGRISEVNNFIFFVKENNRFAVQEVCGSGDERGGGVRGRRQ